MRLGVTGTQDPECVTVEAKAEFVRLVSELKPIEMHHGGCVGGDAAMHNIVDDLFGCAIYIHPPIYKGKTAFLFGKNVTLLTPRDYLDRNKDIVQASDVIVAMPRGTEEEVCSGTWQTVRQAVKLSKPLHVVWPSGERTFLGPRDVVKPAWWTQTRWPRDRRQRFLNF